MADQQRRVSLIFDANTSQAKNRIDELANSINKILNIGSTSTGISSIDKELQAAAKNAAILQTQLKNAVNVRTGALDLTKFNESLQQSGMSLEKYYKTFTNIGPAGEQAFSNLARSIATAEIPLRRSSELLNSFAVSLKNTVKWQISSSLMHGFMSTIQGAISYAQNLNSNLNDIRIVTGQSADEMARFAEQANRSAKELSTTTNTYAKAALIFYQQGLNDKEVKERTDAVIKMANVTGEAAKEVSSYMTAIWNNFDDGSKSLEYYADVITKLGASTAASSAEIAGGLEKFAAVGNTIGLSYEYATAMLTTIIDKTRQSEDVVGTALKTILARIQGLNLGETLEDGTTLNKYSEALATVGVQIKDTSGELRSMNAILNDLGEKWQTLSKDTQVALAQVVGGVRQYNQIISLMDNWDAFELNVDIAMNAEGELQKQADIYAESWEAAKNRVQASAEAIYASLLDDKFFIGFNNTLSKILDQINNLIKGMGGVKGVVITLGTVLTTVFNQQITSSLKNLSYNLQMMTKTGQQKLIEIQRNSQTLMSKMGSDKGTIGGGIIGDAYAKEASAQKQLLSISEKLSKAEQETANALMRQVQLRTDQQVSAGQNASIAQQELELSIDALERFKNSLTVAKPAGLDDIINKINTISTIAPQMGSFYNQAALIINNSSDGASVKIEKLRDLIKSSEQSLADMPAESQQAFEALKASLDSTNPSFESIKENLRKFIAPMDEAKIKIEDFIINLRNLAEIAKKEGNIELANQYNRLADHLDNCSNKAKNFGEALSKAGIAQNNSAQAIKILNQYLSETGIHVMSVQEKIVTWARILGTLAMAINQIKGLVEIWNDDTKTLGEKLLTTATTLGFLIPMIISTATSIKNMGISAIASKLALQGMSAAEVQATINTMGLKSALDLLKGPIGIATLAITGLVGAIILLSKESEKKITLEDQLKNLNSQLDSLKTKAKEVKEQIDGINSSFDSYQTVRDSLDNCTEGTSLWYEALRKVQEQSMEMLSTYPILAKILNDPLKYFGDDFDVASLYDEHGILNMELLTQRALELSSEEYNINQLALGIANTEARSVQRAIDESATIEDIVSSKDIDSKIFPNLYDTLQAIVSNSGGIVGNFSYQDWVDWQKDRGWSEETGLFGFTNAISTAENPQMNKIIEKTVENAIKYGLENNIESLDEAILSYLSLDENDPLKSFFTLALTGDTEEEILSWTDVDTRNGSLNFIEFLKNNVGDPGIAEAYYTGQASSAIQQIKSIPDSYYVGLANNIISDRRNIYGLEQLDFLRKVLPYYMADTEYSLDTSPLAFENYRTYLRDRSTIDTNEYNWGGIKEQEDGSWIVPFEDATKEGGLTIVPSQLAAQQMWFDADFVNSTLEQANDLWGSLSDVPELRKVISSGDFSDLTYSEREKLSQNTSIDSYLESINSVLGTSFSQDSIFEGWKDNWDKNLSQIQNETIDSLGTGISEAVREWGKNNGGLLQLFPNGVLDLSVMNDSSISDIINTRSTGAEKYLGLGSNMFDLTEAYNKILEGKALTQEELDLITTYTDLTEEAFRETADGWVMIGEATENVLTSAVQGVEAISQAVDNIKNTGESTNLDWSNLTADQETILDYLGYKEDILAQLTDSEKEQAELEYQAILNGEKALELTDAQIAAWLSTIQSWEQFNQTGKEFENLPAYIQEVILSNISKIEGYDLETLIPYAGDNGITNQSSYNAAVSAYKRSLGFNGILGWDSNFKGLNEKIEAGATIEGTPEIKESLEEIAKFLTNFTGMEGIDANWVFDNWDSIKSIYESGSLLGLQTSIGESFGIPLDISKYYGNMIASAFGAQTIPIDLYKNISSGALGLLNSLNLKEGYFNTGRNEFLASGKELELLLTGREPGQLMTENQALYFREKKLLDDSLFNNDGTLIEGWQEKDLDSYLTTEAKNLGFNTIEELVSATEAAFTNGVKSFDIKTLGFSQAVMDVYNNGLSEARNKDTGLYYLNTAEDQEAYANILNEGYKLNGAIGLKYYDQLAQEAVKAGISIDKFSERIKSVDWSNANSVNEFALWLTNAGVTVENVNLALENLQIVANATAEALSSISEAANKYNKKTSVADKIRSGEEITLEDYAEMVSIFGEELARSMMSATATGQYKLSEYYNSNAVASAIEENSIRDFKDIQAESLKALTASQSYMNEAWTILDKDWLGYAASRGTELQNLGIITDEQLNALTYASNEGISTEDMKLKMSDSSIWGDNYNWDNLFSAITSIAQKDYEESTEAIADAKTRTPRENMEAEWAAEGFSKEEIELIDKYGDSIQELAKDSEYLSEELVENANAADEIASELMRYEKGLQKVVESTKDWSKSLKENAKGSKEYIKTTEEMSDTLEDIYDLEDGTLDDLELDWERLNRDMVKMAEGSAEEAAEAYQDGMDIINDAMILDAGLVPDLDMTQFESGLSDSLVSMNEWQNLVYDALNNIEAGGIIDGALLSSLESMLSACYSTVDEAQAALTNMGVDGEVVIADEPITNTTPTNDIRASLVDNGYLSVPIVAADGSVTMGPKIPIQGVKYSAISNTNTSEGSVQNVGFKIVPGTGKTNVTRKAGGAKSGMGSRPTRTGGGGGGGGGGGRRPTAETKKEPDKARYHTITNQLEDLTDAYDKVSKAADRAFGKARIKLLQDQRKELQKLAAAQQSYIDEINDYYKQDLSNLDQVSAYVGFKVQLDENGTITNFDEIQNKMWEEYNRHIDEKGEVIDMDEEAWKKYEEEWQRIMDLITKYEETQDLRKEALQQLQDYINEIYDLQLEEVTYSVEIDIEASDYALEILDYLLKQVEDDAWSAAEAIAYMGDQAADFLDQSQTYNSGIADILRNHTRDITDANGKVLRKASLTEADIQGYLNGDQASIDKIRELGLKGEFTDEEIQSLKDYHSQLLEINQSLIDLREQVYDTLSDSFSKFNEELQDTIDIMEHLTNVTDSYRNIIDLVGKKNVGISNALLESFSQIQTNQAIDLVKAQKSRLDDLTAMRDEAEALRQKMLAEGNEKDAKEIEERIKEMNKQIREATEDYTGALEDALQRAEDQFKLHISNIIEDANQAFAGAMVNIQQLQDMFNLKNDTNNIYLEDFEKIYELNKLNRDITNSIDETSNIKAKEELAKLQAEINALEEDGVKVSQYQTEDLRRRYELKLAEIALNEAKDAKSQVQMTRDADGNWSYVYTADENQVAEAEQNYEDRLYELQRANADYINEMQDLLIQTEAELMAKIEEITNDQTLSLEEKQALIDEFTAQYTEKFNGYAGELKLVLDNNKLLYEDEWTAYSNLTGYKISADENYIDNFNETMLSTLTGFQTAEEFHQNFNDTTEMLLNESNIAFEEWENNVDKVFDAAGLSSEDLAETLEDQFNNISNDSEDLAEDIEDTGDRAVETFGDIVDAVDNWYEQYSATIDRVLEQNTALAKSFRELLSAWSDYQEGSEVEDSGDDTGDEPPADEETPVEEETEPETLDPVEKANKYKKGIAFAIWHYPGGAGWGNGQTRRQRMAEKGMDYKTVQAQINRYEGKKAKAMASDSGLSGTEESLRPYIYKEFAFDTGGYTGSWGREGRWALLHEKEIVLNKEDTSNLLSAINMIRQISEVIDLNAYSSAGFGKGIGVAASVGSAGTLEQVVHVTAEFPNATNKDEIYAAFGEIINLASQYANRR